MQSYYSHERWTFSRVVDARSPSPDRAKVIGCRSCGAPLDKLVGGRCAHCETVVEPGCTDWLVEGIEVVERIPRPPQLTGDTPEVGSDDPTLTAPDLREQYAALTTADSQLSWSAFEQRVRLVFHTFHRAWSAQELEDVRAFFSDNLFETQRYWIEAYRAQQLRNVTEAPEISSVALSRIVRDAYFDAVTVRIFARCIDYTVDVRGELVGGNRDVARVYSEYWTFIRSATKRGAPGTAPTCPSCGASIGEINMTGVCSHCRAKVTTGEFDWVLSRIEQDEEYRL